MTVTDATVAEAALIELFVNRSGRVDPYPLYHQVRSVAPVHKSSFGPWFLTSHAEASAVLRDATFGRLPAGVRAEFDPRMAGTYLYETQGRNMLFNDPPDHTRLRRLVSKAFTPNAVEGLRPYIRAFVERTLDRAEADGGFDVSRTSPTPCP